MDEFFRHVLTSVAVALGLAYILAGTLLVTYDVELLGLGTGLRISFGILLILYGIYRIARTFRRTPGK